MAAHAQRIIEIVRCPSFHYHLHSNLPIFEDNTFLDTYLLTMVVKRKDTKAPLITVYEERFTRILFFKIAYLQSFSNILQRLTLISNIII